MLSSSDENEGEDSSDEDDAKPPAAKTTRKRDSKAESPIELGSDTESVDSGEGTYQSEQDDVSEDLHFDSDSGSSSDEDSD